MEENFLKTELSVELTAPTVPKLACSVKLERDSSDVENNFVFEFNVNENDTSNMVS